MLNKAVYTSCGQKSLLTRLDGFKKCLKQIKTHLFNLHTQPARRISLDVLCVYGNNIGYYFDKSSEAVIWAAVSIHTTVVSSLQHSS